MDPLVTHRPVYRDHEKQTHSTRPLWRRNGTALVAALLTSLWGLAGMRLPELKERVSELPEHVTEEAGQSGIQKWRLK